jgi:tRNA-binding EMAP/Myf-like protein
MISKRKIIYSLIFLIFILGVLIRITIVKKERQAKVKTVAGQWQEKGKPVITQEVKARNIKIYSKITITPDVADFGYAYLPEAIQKKIKPGQLIFKGDKDDLSVGEVVKVAKEIDLDTGLYFIKVKLKENIFNSKKREVVYINRETLKDVICLPREVVNSRDHQNFVWVIEGDKAKKKIVKIAKRDGYGVIIQSGLSEGERVVLEGYTMLSEGDKVSIIKGSPGEKND